MSTSLHPRQCCLEQHEAIESIIEISYHEAAGEMRRYTELLLGAWLARYPQVTPEQAEVVIDTTDPHICRISIRKRGEAQ